MMQLSSISILNGVSEAAATATLEYFYHAIAELLSCQRDEIAYIENATRAWDMAFYSLPLESGDQILTHSSEYASNYLAYLQQARRRGLKVDVVPSDQFGQIDVAALESMINERTRLISINHIPTQSGLVNPAEKVGKIASRQGRTSPCVGALF
jgi:selenocysteine lyase/cysteine desulfurase